MCSAETSTSDKGNNIILLLNIVEKLAISCCMYLPIFPLEIPKISPFYVYKKTIKIISTDIGILALVLLVVSLALVLLVVSPLLG